MAHTCHHGCSESLIEEDCDSIAEKTSSPVLLPDLSEQIKKLIKTNIVYRGTVMELQYSTTVALSDILAIIRRLPRLFSAHLFDQF